MLSDRGTSAVVQITAGAGGTESCDWAMLMHVSYMAGAEKPFCKSKLNFQKGEAAGIKPALEFERRLELLKR
jgi:peptide chain release factor 2